MINVTKVFLPPFEEYTATLKRAWDKSWITNNGELVRELEDKLKEYLGVKHLFFSNNGTIVLQMALKVYNITREVITTPFSYVATTTSILWEGCKPVFVDIDKRNYCIDVDKIEAAITENTQAIMVTHVYGLACDVERIQEIADRYKLKVIYDGAHAFGSVYKDKSLLSYGDISTCSFHATKIFHSVEGGCIITHDEEIARQLMLYRQFGHVYDDYFSIGVNAKNSEFHAAMGIEVLKKFPLILESRKKQWLFYKEGLGSFASWDETVFQYNYAYFPVCFSSQNRLLECMEELKRSGIMPRRYFFPSLNRLPYFQGESCPVSEKIAESILCLPLFYELEKEDQQLIIDKVSGFL